MTVPSTPAAVNSALGERLRVHGGGGACTGGHSNGALLPLHQADPNMGSDLTTAAFLQALARYPIPVVSAATAIDVGGADPQPPLSALLVASRSQPDGPAVHTDVSPGGRRSGASDGGASQAHSRARRSSRPSGALRVATPGRRSAAPAEPPVHRLLTAALDDVWRPSSPVAEDAQASLNEPSQPVGVSTPPPRPSCVASVSVTPPVWAAASPFRFCADPSFHAALQHLSPSPSTTAPAAPPTSAGAWTQPVRLGVAWSIVDARCHGFFASASATGRKRLRTAAPLASAALTTEESYGRAAMRALQEAVSSSMPVQRTAPQSAHMHAAQRDGSSTSRAATSLAHEAGGDALRSRVADNDDLLDLLLHDASTEAEDAPSRGVEQAEGHAAVQPHTNADAVHAFAVGHPAGAPLRPSPLGAPLAGAGSSRPPLTSLAQMQLFASALDAATGGHYAYDTVKSLKEACARHGLLTTGSRTVLEQRLRLYRASGAHRQAPIQGLGSTDATASTAPGHISRPTMNSTACPTVVTTPNSTAAAATVPAGLGIPAATRPAATGSPPRTVFRYRSPSQPTLASAAPLPSPCERGASAASASSAPMDRMPPNTDPAVRCRRRTVPSPTQFLQDLAAAKPLPPITPLSALCGTGAPPTGTATADGTTAPAAVHAAGDELKCEMSQVRWQWLVDFRERAGRGGGGGGGGGGRQHAGMLEMFRRQQVPCTSVVLPAGDFALAVELLPEEAEELQACAAPSATDLESRASAHGAATSTGAPAAGDAPVLSHVCAIAVERKTAADLDASVKGVRYGKQRRLLTTAPYRAVVWLIEGTDVGAGHSSGSSNFGFARGPASRSPSPSTSAESARQRVDSACASLGLHAPGWLVVRTRSTAESVQFLKMLATQVARQLADYRLHRRACAGDAFGLGALHGVCVPTASSPAAPAGSGTSLDALFAHVGRRCRPSADSRPPLCMTTAPVTPALCMAAGLPLLCLAPTQKCLHDVAALQRHLLAKTAFPRMLMCVRGCSAALAAFLSAKYGTLLRFWRELRRRGREACDADADVQRLSTAQKKVFVLLTEFLLTKDYF